jgi:hypothetical protein
VELSPSSVSTAQKVYQCVFQFSYCCQGAERAAATVLFAFYH